MNGDIVYVDKKAQYCQGVSFAQHGLQVRCNPYQNPNQLFYGYLKTDPKVCMERKRHKIPKPREKEKSKVGELIVPDKTHYKASK